MPPINDGCNYTVTIQVDGRRPFEIVYREVPSEKTDEWLDVVNGRTATNKKKIDATVALWKGSLISWTWCAALGADVLPCTEEYWRKIGYLERERISEYISGLLPPPLPGDQKN